MPLDSNSYRKCEWYGRQFLWMSFSENFVLAYYKGEHEARWYF
jgi:hypothetical protein